MKVRTREEAAAYKRELRARKRVPPNVPPVEKVVPPMPIFVPPSVKCPTFDVPPCPTCADMVLKNGILRGRVLMLESELREAKKKIPPKPDSPYRGF